MGSKLVTGMRDRHADWSDTWVDISLDRYKKKVFPNYTISVML